MKKAPDEKPRAARLVDATTLALPLGDTDYEALIDYADGDLVAGFYWRPLVTTHETVYAHAWHGCGMHLYLHRLVIGAGPNDTVDHINGNGLDNRQINLRQATPSTNSANRPKDRPRNRAAFSSRYKGVHWDASRSRWGAHIHFEGKGRQLGRYDSEEEAARAYDKAAIETWGPFARPNFPHEHPHSNTTPLPVLSGG